MREFPVKRGVCEAKRDDGPRPAIGDSSHTRETLVEMPIILQVQGGQGREKEWNNWENIYRCRCRSRGNSQGARGRFWGMQCVMRTWRNEVDCGLDMPSRASGAGRGAG
jgi:hypothetical protein